MNPEGIRRTLRDSGGVIPASRVDDLRGANTVEEFMLGLLDVLKARALAPVSDFSVGAAGLGASGAMYPGVNLEFPGLSLMYCVHAEQAVVTNALMAGENSLSMLSVSAPPCGFCRQFLYELNSADELRILLPNHGTRLLGDFLPEAFGPLDLDNPHRLMSPERGAVKLTEREPAAISETLRREALRATGKSYAPYSGGRAGVALRTNSGGVFSGAYVENAAFNPTISPMAGALANLRIAGGDFTDIAEAVLMETESEISQLQVCAVILASVCDIELKHSAVEVEL